MTGEGGRGRREGMKRRGRKIEGKGRRGGRERSGEGVRQKRGVIQ